MSSNIAGDPVDISRCEIPLLVKPLGVDDLSPRDSVSGMPVAIHSAHVALHTGILALRRAHPVLSKEQFHTDAEVRWLPPNGGAPDWADPNKRQLGCLMEEGGPSHPSQTNSIWVARSEHPQH